MTDIEQALLDPTSVFDHPKEVLNASDISTEKKLQILRRWEYDAHRLEVAEEENMFVVGQPDILDDILEAIHMLESQRE